MRFTNAYKRMSIPYGSDVYSLPPSPYLTPKTGKGGEGDVLQAFTSSATLVLPRQQMTGVGFHDDPNLVSGCEFERIACA